MLFVNGSEYVFVSQAFTNLQESLMWQGSSSQNRSKQPGYYSQIGSHCLKAVKSGLLFRIGKTIQGI